MANTNHSSTLMCVIILFCSLASASCAKQLKSAEQQELENSIISAHVEAKKNSVTPCNSKPECDKMFSMAKIFVYENSDMKIQFADDTIISTYNPIEWHQCGMNVKKVPGAKDSATIFLQIDCIDRLGSVDLLPMRTINYQKFRETLRSVREIK